MNDIKCTGISVVSIWTDKMLETIEFYKTTLKLQVCDCNSYHMKPIHFIVGNSFLVLLNGKMEVKERGDTFPLIAIDVNDIDETCNYLERNNIEILQGLQEDNSSRWTFCKDPGGNLVELVVWK